MNSNTGLAREVLFDKEHVKGDLQELRERFLWLPRWKVFWGEGTAPAKVWGGSLRTSQQQSGGGATRWQMHVGRSCRARSRRPCQCCKSFGFYSKWMESLWRDLSRGGRMRDQWGWSLTSRNAARKSLNISLMPLGFSFLNLLNPVGIYSNESI